MREATVLRGHAVRAGYLAAGAVDVAVERGDEELLAALATQWENTVARRTYLTGGQGSHHQDEAFGDDWVLPPDRAYSETCAGVGSIMFSWRLLLAQRPAPRYADLIERTLFNVVATSPSATGTAFFYANTLHQRVPGAPARDDVVSPRASSSLRAPWFEVSCCPPNVARTLASLAAYVATADDDGVQLHQYAPAAVRTTLPDGRPVALDVETDYPRDGVVRVHVREDAGHAVDADPAGAGLGRRRAARRAPRRRPAVEQPAAPGSVAVRRAFRDGDVVELRPAGGAAVHRRRPAHRRRPRLRRRGARPGGALPGVGRPGRRERRADRRHRGRPARPRGRARARWTARSSSGCAATAPPRPGLALRAGRGRGRPGRRGLDVPLVPYHDWAERGPSTMRVWLPSTRS